jgi:Protein of unknown function (DUF4038)/Putative collagen-binding domain of a collagenase
MDLPATRSSPHKASFRFLLSRDQYLELQVRIAVPKTALVVPMAFLIAVGIGCGRDGNSRIHGPSLSRLSIAKQPASHTVMAGQTTTFEVLAKGIGRLHYQWFKNGARLSGATSARYTIPPTTIDDDGSQFRVVVTSWGRSITSESATLRVLAPARKETVSFPVKVSSNGRYLEDQTNKPFRIQGDSAWSLIANLTYEDAERYLSDQKAKGFNTILVNLFEHKYAQGGKGSTFSGVPTNRNGDLPFSAREGGGAYDGTWGTADFSKPNEAYFAFADSIIDLAALKGMLVNLAPMFLGFNGKDSGWWAELTNRVNTQTVVYDFGLYIGNRYKNRRNIIWIIGGDYFPPPGSEGEARLLKFMQGIKAAGATQLWSGDWSASCLSTDEEAFAPLMNLNAVYTYGVLGHPGATYDESRAAYAYSPPRPAYVKETGYEDERWFPGDPASVRMYEYYAVLGGSTAGGFFGNRDAWKFATDRWWFDPASFGHGPWTTAMESTGTLDFVYLGRLLDSVAWYRLVPSELSGMRRLVTRGGGNYRTTDYVAAAATSDGTALLAYVPPTRKGPTNLTVDMTALAGLSRGSWFDPTSGRLTAVTGATFPNVATRTFTTPGMNSRGEGDWVLVLRVR